MKLHLGVIDIPYEEGGETTADVAQYLEDNYGVMQYFFDTHTEQIIGLLEKDLAGSLENIMAGAPPSNNPFMESMSEIHNLFVIFLETNQMDGQPGVPTKRALDGISKRLKSKKGDAPRPSFIDTGLYEASMRSWVSEVMQSANS